MRKDIANFCKTCHHCQMVGKPNQGIPQTPLHPIPAFEEPFSRILIDCVGPLPKTKSGNEYLLTLMCASTRYPEANPLRKINARSVIKALVKFCTTFGLPKVIQSDRGTNFTSNVFNQISRELDIKHVTSSAYHPESQGALERFHQTLKTMMKTFCNESSRDWDESIHLLLFAARESVQESLGFSPFELVFGHVVRGPLKLIKEKWLNENEEISLLDYVSDFKGRLMRACEIARENLQQSQHKMKTWYDAKSKARVFSPGDKVLVLFPVPKQPLQAKYSGPYEILQNVSDVNYIVKTPDRRKSKQLCHINMIKAYNAPQSDDSQSVLLVSPAGDKSSESDTSLEVPLFDIRLHNSYVLHHLHSKLNHLQQNEQETLSNLIIQYNHLFPDVPSRTSKIFHDVDVGNASPVKQVAYRTNPSKLAVMHAEVEYMLENDIIERSFSAWSSPCLLVPKQDGSFRFCTDFRKVNKVSKTNKTNHIIWG